MLKVNKEEVLQKEIDLLINSIIGELEVKFEKNTNQAVQLVKKARVYEHIMKEPLGLHDSAEQWALIVLADNDDLQAIEKYYS